MKYKIVISKMKEKGFAGTIKAAVHLFFRAANQCAFYYYQHQPLKKNLIVMESEGDLTDNTYALFDYMRRHGLLKKYKIVWMVNDVEKATNENIFPNTIFCEKYPESINLKWAKSMACCHWFIYDHCNLFLNLVKRPEQKIINLWHGTGYKATTENSKYKKKTTDDIIMSLSPMSGQFLAYFLDEPFEKTVVAGSPRLDYFFQNDKAICSQVETKMNFRQYTKILFWMPTFRQSDSINLSEEYLTNETGLPIFTTIKDIQTISDFLKQHNLLMIFKLHHLQANLPVFKKKWDNILLLRDEDLHQMGLQLYQFIPFSDALITDYSSVAIDYLLLDKPIIFTLDDYDEYAKNRGFWQKNAKDYMKGYHVYNKDELENSILEISQGVDRYAEERRKIRDEYHTYKDGNASKRILKIIGIIK